MTTALCLLLATCSAPPVAFEGAEGFGAIAGGGSGGQVLFVDRVGDDPQSRTPGSFRWAVHQLDPRIV